MQPTETYRNSDLGSRVRAGAPLQRGHRPEAPIERSGQICLAPTPGAASLKGEGLRTPGSLSHASAFVGRPAVRHLLESTSLGKVLRWRGAGNSGNKCRTKNVTDICGPALL